MRRLIEKQEKILYGDQVTHLFDGHHQSLLKDIVRRRTQRKKSVEVLHHQRVFDLRRNTQEADRLVLRRFCADEARQFLAALLLPLRSYPTKLGRQNSLSCPHGAQAPKRSLLDWTASVERQ